MLEIGIHVNSLDLGISEILLPILLGIRRWNLTLYP
jgi:hypothetical protein